MTTKPSLYRRDEYIVRIRWNCCDITWSYVWDACSMADARRYTYDECVLCGRVRRAVAVHRMTRDEVDAWRRAA